MLNFVANHALGLVGVLIIVLFVNAILGYMNTEVLEVLKATVIAQQNS